MEATDAARHRIVRVRHEVVRRTLVVESVEELTPRMRRVRLRSRELVGFRSLAPDDHVKVFFGDAIENARDFTPRAFDAEHNLLTIDFALHEHGPATAWASRARPGDTLQIGGPRGSMVVADDFDWYVFVGDESSLPAIGRWLETLRASVPVTTIVAIADDRERQTPLTRATWTPWWVVRGEPAEQDAQLVARAAREIVLPPGDGFVWIAGEQALVRAARAVFVDERRHPSDWVKTASYWHRKPVS